MDEPPRRRTPHALWAAGALLLLAAIAAAWPRASAPRPASPAEEAPAIPAPVHVPSAAGKVPCGFCDGDGRVDARDKARPAPRLNVAEGPCPACAGKGGR